MLRFTVLTIGVLTVSGALVVTLLPEVAAHRVESNGDAIIFAGALTTTVVGAALLARRDTYAFAWLVACLAAFGLAGAGLTQTVEAPVTAGLLGFAVGAALLLALGAAYIARTQFRRGDVPDILAENLGKHAVFEIDDVQVSATCPATTPENVIAPIHVYLQNCLDSPRTVTIDLDDEPILGTVRSVTWRMPEPVQLGPGEVKSVRIPFCCGQSGGITRTAYLRVRASGARGKRIRHRRAPYAAHPWTVWQLVAVSLLASPFFLILAWGRGGVKLKIRFSPAEPLRRLDELPPPTVTVLWPRPSPSPELAGAERSESFV